MLPNVPAVPGSTLPSPSSPSGTFSERGGQKKGHFRELGVFWERFFDVFVVVVVFFLGWMGSLGMNSMNGWSW